MNRVGWRSRLVPSSSAIVAFLLLVAFAPVLVADILVLDRSVKTVSRLDASSLEVKASALLPEVPTRVVLSPDGAAVVVLCRGEGEDKYDGFRARTKALAIVLEAATLKERARVELGWGIGPATWDAAGRTLVVLSPGYPSKSPEKRQTASVVSFDLAGTARRVPLERAALEMVIAPDGNVAAVLSTRVDGPSHLVFADLAMGISGNPVVLAGEPTDLLLAPDGVMLYVLDRGKPETGMRSGKAFGDVPGSLAVFSLAERRKTGDIHLGATTAIGGFDRTGRLILGGARAGNVRENRISVVKGGAVEWEVTGPASPTTFRFSPDGRNALALGWNSAFVHFGDFTAAPSVSIVPVLGRGLYFGTTPDGKLALAFNSDLKTFGDAIVYELASGKVLKTFNTTSTGARIGAAIASVGATIASIDAGRRDAERHGRSTYAYSIYTPNAAASSGTPVVMRPDGKVAFVYDPFGGEVLSLDLEKLEKGKRQPVGSGSSGLFLTGGGKTLLVASETGLSTFDTTHFVKTNESKTRGPAEIQTGPAGEALLCAKGLVASIDPATGKLAAQSTSFGLPLIGAFLP